jgi:hypothetical protein
LAPGDRSAVGWIGAGTLLVQIPLLTRGFSVLDEGSLLAIARSLAEGEVLYRDRFTFIGPLGYEWMRLLIDVFGSSLLVGRVFQAFVFTLTSLLVYRILREFGGVGWASLGAVACLPLKLLAFPLWTVPNYSQLAMMTSLVAVAAGLRFFATQRVAWLATCGVAIGATVVTKQSLGAAIAASVAFAVGLDALLRSRPRLRPGVARAAILAGAAAGPIVAAVAFYAAQGAVGAFLDRAVVGLFDIAPEFRVPLPSLEVWSFRSAVLGSESFKYFPTPVLALAWQARLDLTSWSVAFSIEHAVKLTYYLPLAAIAVAAVGVVRELKAGGRPAQAAGLALIVAYAALAYWSIAYRADFTHLMSVAPPLLIVCGVSLRRVSAGWRWGSTVSLSTAGAWLAAGGMVALCVFAAYATPIDTRHGRLWGTKYDADDAGRVLAYLEEQPKDARILMLRTEPLYYVLSDRAIPGPFDVFLPGYLRSGDDDRFAESLSGVDQVVYNPAVLPTVPSPIAAYAPATAARLAARFRIAEILGPAAVVLVPRTGPGSEVRTVFEIGSGSNAIRSPSGAEKVAGADWMMYRVVTTSIEPDDSATCFSVSHDVEPGEGISATPMLHPDTWAPRWPLAEARRARFEIRVTPSPESQWVAFSGERAADSPAAEVEVALSGFVGRRVDLEFCSFRASSEAAEGQRVRAGWAEPRVVRNVGGATWAGGR